MPFFFSPDAHASVFSAVWRLRGRLRARDFFRRPLVSGRDHHIRESLTIAIRHMFRKHSLLPREQRPDSLRADCGNSGANGNLAQRGGQVGGMAGAAVRAERTPREGRVYGRLAENVGGTGTAASTLVTGPCDFPCVPSLWWTFLGVRP